MCASPSLFSHCISVPVEGHKSWTSRLLSAIFIWFHPLNFGHERVKRATRLYRHPALLLPLLPHTTSGLVAQLEFTTLYWPCCVTCRFSNTDISKHYFENQANFWPQTNPFSRYPLSKSDLLFLFLLFCSLFQNYLTMAILCKIFHEQF